MFEGLHDLVRVASQCLRTTGPSDKDHFALDPACEAELGKTLRALAGGADQEDFLTALTDLEVFALFLRSDLDSPLAANALQALLGTFPQMQKARAAMASERHENIGSDFARFLGPESDELPPASEPPISARDFLRKLIK